MRIKRTISWVFPLFAVVILGVVALSVHDARKNNKPVNIFGYQFYIVITGSMEPTIKTNGLAVSRDGGYDNIEVGDIVAFRSVAMGGQSALHRVIEKTPEGYITQGDNNPSPDGGVMTAENFIGKVIFISNFTASYSSRLNTPNGILRMVVAPSIIILLLSFAMTCFMSQKDWRTKGFAASIIVTVVSVSIFTSYQIFLARSDQLAKERYAQIIEDFYERTESSEKTSFAGGKEILGIIEIPKLELKYPIIRYEKPASLDVSITKYSGPALNRVGNIVLAGHRSTYRNIFFTKTDSLELNDKIIVTDEKLNQRTYTVSETKIVHSSDTSILAQDVSTYYLTLISCTYDAKDRHVVIAESYQADHIGELR